MQKKLPTRLDRRFGANLPLNFIAAVVYDRRSALAERRYSLILP